MNRKGFSLIELLIVIAIIGILAAIAIPGYLGQQRSAARSEAETNLQNLRLLEEQFFADRGSYTKPLGEPGKDKPNNITCIQKGRTAFADADDPTNALTGFKPGAGLAFSYWTVSGERLKMPLTNPPTSEPIAAGDPPCFVAFARGNTVGRVPNETFAIDCNNNKNF